MSNLESTDTGAETVTEIGADTTAGVRLKRRLSWGRCAAVFGGLVVLAVAVFAGRHWRIQALTAECKNAVDRNDWQQLEVSAHQLRFWQPERAVPLIYLAEAANQQGRLEEAVQLLQELPDNDEMTAPALLECSHLLFGPLNRPIEGAAVLERALRLEPRLCEARRRLVYFYAFTLQRRKMVNHIYAAIDHDCDLPETYVYLFGQDWLSFANAFDENSRWLVGNPDEELFLVARAIYRITSKALDETDAPANQTTGVPEHKQIVQEYFQRFPQNLELIAYFLREASTNGDTKEVARLLALAPPQAKEDNRFWRFMGWLHYANQEWREAERCYETALTINPYDYVAQHQFASVLRRLDRMDHVDMLESLAREGQNLRRDILQLPDVTSVPQPILKRMQIHAGACGDQKVADKLYQRTHGDR